MRLTRSLSDHGRTCARIGAGGAALLLLFVPLGCRRGGADRSEEAKKPTSTPVEVVTAVTGTATRWTSVTGSLVSLNDVAVSSKMPGRLAEVLVREGDPVSAGQVLARLDMSDQEAQVRAAEAAVAAAEARVAQAEAAYRQQVASSRSTLEAAEAAYRQQIAGSGSRVRAAEAAYHQQQVNTRTGIDAAEAALEAARAQLSQVREGARAQDVRRTETQVAIARSSLTKAQSDLKRYRALAREGAVAASMLEQYETAARVAEEQLRGAEESLSLVKEGARTQEVVQAEQAVRQAEERLRQAKAAAALDEVRKADVVMAQAALAQNDVQRANVEMARAALAQNEVRRADVLAARAALKQARSSLDIARKALADASICSPISGQVASRSADPGHVVSPGVPILRVVSLDSVYFEPTVPDRELASVRVGQPVQVKVNAFPDRVFTGQVARIYPAGTRQSRSFPVRIPVSNPDRALRPEMFAQGRIESERHANAVLVPETALLRSTAAAGADNQARLFIVENGVARERRVSLGLKGEGNLIEVQGISANDPVVVAGQTGLADGDKVEVKPARTAATPGTAPPAPKATASSPADSTAAEKGRW